MVNISALPWNQIKIKSPVVFQLKREWSNLYSHRYNQYAHDRLQMGIDLLKNIYILLWFYKNNNEAIHVNLLGSLTISEYKWDPYLDGTLIQASPIFPNMRVRQEDHTKVYVPWNIIERYAWKVIFSNAHIHTVYADSIELRNYT